MGVSRESKGTIIIDAIALETLICPVPGRFKLPAAEEGRPHQIANYADILPLLAENGYKVVITQESLLRTANMLCGIRGKDIFPESSDHTYYLQQEAFAHMQNWVSKLNDPRFRRGMQLVDSRDIASEIAACDKLAPHARDRELRRIFMREKKSNSWTQSVRDYIAAHPTERITVLSNDKHDNRALVHELQDINLLNVAGLLLALQQKELLPVLGLNSYANKTSILSDIYNKTRIEEDRMPPQQGPIDVSARDLGQYSCAHPFIESLTDIAQRLKAEQAERNIDPADVGAPKAIDEDRLEQVKAKWEQKFKPPKPKQSQPVVAKERKSGRGWTTLDDLQGFGEGEGR